MKEFSSKFAPLIVEYLEFRMAMGITTVTHENNLAYFDRFCAEYYPLLESLSKEAVRGWISYERSQEHRGLLNKVSDIRMFAKYLGNGSYMLPAGIVPKNPPFVPYILTDEELTAFFRAVDNLKYEYDPFIQETAPVLFRLLYTCGIRPREARLIKRANICFATGEILIDKAKRRKQRIIVMSSDMLEMCKRYDIKRSVVARGEECFFVRSDGLPLANGQLRYIFKLCWTAANPGVPEGNLPNVRPYDLRHRYASAILQKWLDEGRNLYAMLPYLRAYMGHERFSDTAYYIHILPENLLRSPGVDWGAIDSTVPEVSVWSR